jgi:cobalt-zinc-cadmium efflux system protein
MDSVHNLSDEMGLVLIFVAYAAASGMSRNLLRSANFFNSVGLLTLSAVLVWQATERLFDPRPVAGMIPVIVGLAAAAANWGVARLLRAPSADNAAVRLAYLHNLGDALVSLAPVLAGLLVTFSGQSFFDPLIALLVALWIIASTIREVAISREELIWTQKIVCGHSRIPRS